MKNIFSKITSLFDKSKRDFFNSIKDLNRAHGLGHPMAAKVLRDIQRNSL